MIDDLRPALAKALAAARYADLPAVEEGTWYRTPALKVGGKGFARVKDAGTLVLMCALEEKELLLQAAPDIYFETDHYKGWPAVLVRLDRIGEAELALRLEHAWRRTAPRRLLAARDGVHPDGNSTSRA